jgi:flagellar biosynthesis protein FliQ
MNINDVTELARDSIWVMIKMCGPVMLVALIVGLAVSLVQALTQIQEATLAFIPKILSVFAGLLLLLPFMLTTLMDYTKELYQRLSGGF